MDEFEYEDLSVSKTRRKKQAKEIEQLALQLAELGDNQFNQLELPEMVLREVLLARTTKGRGSHKRQIKHLAGLLRKLDDEVALIREQLDRLDQVAGVEKRQFHQIESLRDRLCSADSFESAFNEMLELCPDIDRKAISRLARSVHQHGDKRASREIFKRLRDEQG